MTEKMVSAEIEPMPNQANRAALALQEMGFQILHIGPTISVEGSEVLWASNFNVSFQPQQKRSMREVEGTEVSYYKPVTDFMQIPQELQSLVSRVMFVEPPELY